MLRSKSIVALLSMSAFFFFLSCNKSNVVSSNGVSSHKQLIKIAQDSSNYTELLYQNDKLLEYKIIANSKTFTSILLSYNNNSSPSSEYYTFNSTDLLKNYYYNSSSRLDSAYIMIKDSTNSYKFDGYLSYYYNDQNQLLKMTQYSAARNLLFTTEYNYDAAGNIIKEHMYGLNGYDEVTTMEYDNKINPWHSLKDYLHYDISLSNNNLISVTTTYANSPSQNNQSEYSYIYDSYGYPLTSNIETTTGGTKSTINEKFEYQ